MEDSTILSDTGVVSTVHPGDASKSGLSVPVGEYYSALAVVKAHAILNPNDRRSSTGASKGEWLRFHRTIVARGNFYFVVICRSKCSFCLYV